MDPNWLYSLLPYIKKNREGGDKMIVSLDSEHNNIVCIPVTAVFWVDDLREKIAKLYNVPLEEVRVWADKDGYHAEVTEKVESCNISFILREE